MAEQASNERMRTSASTPDHLRPRHTLLAQTEQRNLNFPVAPRKYGCTNLQIKTPPCSEDIGTAERNSETDYAIPSESSHEQFHLQHSYQPALIVNEGVFVPFTAENSEIRQEKSDFQKLKAALTPKRKFWENYQDDGAIRRQEAARLKAAALQNDFNRSRTNKLVTPISSPAAGKSKWDQLKDTVKQLSPRLSPKIAAKISDPFASVKRTHARTKSSREKTAHEVTKAHLDAAAWGNSTSDSKARNLLQERQQYESELKSKISAPIDTGRTFLVDRFGSLPMENPTPPYRAPTETEKGESHQGKGLGSTHKRQKSHDSKLEYKCAGLHGTFVASEGTNKQCLLCGQFRAIQGSELCHACEARTPEHQKQQTERLERLRSPSLYNLSIAKIGDHRTRSSSIYTTNIPMSSPFSDPGNPFDQEHLQDSAATTRDLPHSTDRLLRKTGNDTIEQVANQVERLVGRSSSSQTRLADGEFVPKGIGRIALGCKERPNRDTSFYYFYDEILSLPEDSPRMRRAT